MMTFIGYVFLFLWALSSLNGEPLIFSFAEVEDVSFAPTPVWFARLMLVFFLGMGTVRFAFNLWMLPRYVRKLRRGKRIQKAIKQVGTRTFWLQT